MRIDLTPGHGVQDVQIAGSELHRESARASATRQCAPAELDVGIGKLSAAALDAPEVREARVEALRTQVQAGTYSVSARNIASSLLDQMRMRR